MNVPSTTQSNERNSDPLTSFTSTATSLDNWPVNILCEFPYLCVLNILICKTHGIIFNRLTLGRGKKCIWELRKNRLWKTFCDPSKGHSVSERSMVRRPKAQNQRMGRSVWILSSRSSPPYFPAGTQLSHKGKKIHHCLLNSTTPNSPCYRRLCQEQCFSFYVKPIHAPQLTRYPTFFYKMTSNHTT